MYTLTHIYTSIYQIKQSLLLSYVFCYLKKTQENVEMLRLRDLDFDRKLQFLSNTYCDIHVHIKL